MEFDLIFKSLEVDKFQLPNIKINYRLYLKNNGNNNLYVKINYIKYRTEIFEELKANRLENDLIDLGDIFSFVTYFFEVSKPIDLSIVLKIPYNDFRNIIKSRLMGNQILFKIDCIINYETYLKTANGFILQDFGENSKFLHDNNFQYRIKPTESELLRVIQQNKYTEILNIEIPFQHDIVNNDSLNKAINELKFASEGLMKGNYESLLLHSRNAVINHLTRLVNNKDSQNKKRILKEEILNDCLKTTPENLKPFYTNILEQVEKMISNLVQILSKFIHEETGKILMRPLNEDMELIFFSLCLICRYLLKIININHR
ncbi:MAG: hypothetical protein ACRD8K_08445 [Nitrososphaeraceae archaeon]